MNLNVKTVFSQRNCSYRKKIPHLVNVSGWYLHHKVTNFQQQIWTLSLHWEREGRPRGNLIWLHVTTRSGSLFVFDDKVADPTASFSSVEHLCVSRQSLTDTELFQFEWVPDQSKSQYDHPWCCDAAASIAFSHAEYTEKIKSRDNDKTTFVMSRSRENNFRYVEKTTFVMSRSRENNFRYVEKTTFVMSRSREN